MKLNIVFTTLIFISIISLSSSATYISSCQSLTSPGDYILTQDISISGSDCITISSDNVNLYCNGYKIEGDGSSDTHGIYIYKKSYVNVYDCDVDSFYYDLYIRKSDHINLSNLKLLNSGKHGAYITSSSYIKFDGLYMQGNSEDGVKLGSAPNSEFLHVRGEDSSGSVGIEVSDSDYLYVYDYNSSNSNYAFWVEDSDSIKVSSLNSINDYMGIRGRDLVSPTFEDLTISSAKSHAIYLSDDDGIKIQNAVLRNVNVYNNVGETAIYINSAPSLTIRQAHIENTSSGDSINIINAPDLVVEDVYVKNSSRNGLSVDNSNNSHLNNLNISLSGNYLISLRGSNNTVLSNFSLVNSDDCSLYVSSTNYSKIENGYVSGGSNYGVKLVDSIHNSLYNLTILDSSVSNLAFDADADFNTASNLILNYGRDVGLTFYYSSNNTVQNSDISHNFYSGVEFDINCPDNLVANSTISGNVRCLLTSSCEHSSDKYANVWFYSTKLGKVADSIIKDSLSYGVRFAYDTGPNLLTGNHIINNSDYAIRWFSDYPDLIYNNLFNNTYNFPTSGEANDSWNTTLQSGSNIIGGSLIGGNFWGKPDGSGFSDTCIDSDKNGICDSPYHLSSSDTDYYPLAPTTSEHPSSSDCLEFIPPTPDNDTFLYNTTSLPINITNTSHYNYTVAVINLYNYSSLNNSQTCYSLPCFYNFTNLDDGVYYVVGELYLSNGSICKSEVRVFGISNYPNSFYCDLNN